MSEFKGTPGPWHIQDDHGKRWIETAGNDDTIAEIHRRRSKGGVYSCEEALANAKLIAAAPDLLAAAIEVLNGLNDRIDAAVESRSPTPVFEGIAALHDAINKAAT